MEFYAYGQFKAEAMRELAEREHIDLSESYAYTDSYTDLPMLEAVGHPVAVNPDRVLTKFARDHDFEITRFVQPVRLRDRVRDVRLRISACPPGRPSPSQWARSPSEQAPSPSGGGTGPAGRCRRPR